MEYIKIPPGNKAAEFSAEERATLKLWKRAANLLLPETDIVLDRLRGKITNATGFIGYLNGRSIVPSDPLKQANLEFLAGWIGESLYVQGTWPPAEVPKIEGQQPVMDAQAMLVEAMRRFPEEFLELSAKAKETLATAPLQYTTTVEHKGMVEKKKTKEKLVAKDDEEFFRF